MTQDAQKIRLILELRQAGITNTEILAAMERVPRDRFVPKAFGDRAYDGMALPIGHGQTISQPVVVARMIAALHLNDRIKVLEIGAGSGYQTAILSYLSRRVYAIERHRDLLLGAQKLLDEMRCYNVTAVVGDGTLGWPDQAPFERIIVSAAAPEIPTVLTDQLAEGGVMVIPVGDQRRDQMIMRVTRRDGEIHTEDLWPVRFLPLVPGRPEAEGGDASSSERTFGQ
ncbi:MAG: protein-L-isoaspartate(D-aspartate) O-methyltransferase [Rhodospirillaceae bacterium]|nr:protein-L-isoaspartate(D-aspartate) O-methyltransferase [Rhodospirillaceae bacterium]MBT5667926.1 protein-L-isoaspartate(D-aspartate) O-methyltransferase [Rhodospirillaceae bacterium]MBT5808838.1 protein-L-isoaspartate(D-aspartate) O-methyltransferase [Rhodospirillaceae bacterium]